MSGIKDQYYILISTQVILKHTDLYRCLVLKFYDKSNYKYNYTFKISNFSYNTEINQQLFLY